MALVDLRAALVVMLLLVVTMPGADAGTGAEAIVIVGDAAFHDAAATHGWSGTGTVTDPYVLDGLRLAAGPAGEAGLTIRDTTLRFVLRDCDLRGWMRGAELVQVVAPRIEGCTFSDNIDGLWLEDAPGAVVVESLFTDHQGQPLFAVGGSVSLADLVLEGNADSLFVASDQVDARRITSRGNTGDAFVFIGNGLDLDGLFVTGASRGLFALGDALHIGNVTFADVGTALTLGPGTHAVVSHAEMDGCITGIDVGGRTDVTVGNVHIRGCFNALRVADTTGLVVDTVHVEASTTGIRLDDVAQVRLERILVNASMVSALHVQGASDVRDHGGQYRAAAGTAVRLIDAHDATLVATAAQGGARGIQALGTQRLLLQDVSVAHTTRAVHVDGGQQVDMERLVVSDVEEGVFVRNSQATTVRDGLLTVSDTGVRLEGGTGHVLTGNQIHNAPLGMDLGSALNTVVRDNDLRQNEVAITTDGAVSTTITRNHLVDNGLGLRLASVRATTIYDNVFANEQNVAVVGGELATRWSVAPQPGLNIIGGPFIAGNHWHDYAGVDLDGDGLGDIAHAAVQRIDHPVLYAVEPLVQGVVPYGMYDEHPLMQGVVQVPPA